MKGFYKPDSYYRYFRSSDCKLVTGWQEIDGYKYYFKEKNGIRYDNCFLKDKSGNRYYFNSNGKLVVKNGSKNLVPITIPRQTVHWPPDGLRWGETNII